MTNSVKHDQREVEVQLAALEAELSAMGEHAPQDVTKRIEELKPQVASNRTRIAELEKRYTGLKREAERAVPAHQAMTVEMPKWRTTILLGLNSAAIVAAISKSGLPSGVITDAIELFLVGALCALASGSALDWVGNAGLKVADEFKVVDFDSPDIEAQLDGTWAASKGLLLARALTALLRYLSLGFFALGVLSIANSLR